MVRRNPNQRVLHNHQEKIMTHIPHSLAQFIRQRNAISLRTKILLGNLLIVLVTVAAMGYFVFYRSQAANEFLANQFDISVNREIENRLEITVSDEVNNISLFFSSMKNVIDTFGTTSGAVLSNDSSINLEGTDWNAYRELSQLPNGSWDNSNNDISSIFMPASVRINDSLAKELAALKGLDYFSKGLLDKNPDIIAIYFGGKAGETIYYPNIDLAAIVPPDFDVTSRPWYTNAAEPSQAKGKTVWSAPYQDAALNGLVITSSTPVYDDSGNFRGVAGIDLRLATITEHVSSLAVGKTGYGFLIDAKGRAIAMPTQGLQDFNLTEDELQSSDIENLSLINRVPLDVFEVLAKMTSGQSGARLVEINGTNRYIAYKPIPIVGYSLGVVVSEDELLQNFVETNTILENETRQTLFNAVGVIFILLSVAGLASYGIGSSIAAPLEKLTAVAKDVAAGNLDARAEVTSGDEIGILGNTLNNMSSTAQDLVANLEGLVAERTRVIEKRVAQIQAATEVGKAVAAQRDLEELLSRTTHLISNRFGFYHVGIFLLDARSEYAILRAANSSGGQKMLAREHRLRVGTEGIVGTVASSGEARIALDVGKDAVFFDNPDLPQTHSEMALPLIAGGEVLGVLDVQSIEVNAFSEGDIPTLHILADQLAVAVQNARMLRDTQEALFAARKATGEVSQRGWQTLLQDINTAGYIGLTHGEIIPAAENLDDTTKQSLNNGYYVVSENQHTISIPVITRGQTIGMLRLTKPLPAEPWTPDEIADVESLSDQISNALDSARLYNEAQQRATRERTISEITTNIGASTDIEAIMRTAVAELGRQISGAKVAIELSTEIEQEE
jgi:GAF domain-containing protein/HAMP domain-containing protein